MLLGSPPGQDLVATWARSLSSVQLWTCFLVRPWSQQHLVGICCYWSTVLPRQEGALGSSLTPTAPAPWPWPLVGCLLGRAATLSAVPSALTPQEGGCLWGRGGAPLWPVCIQAAKDASPCSVPPRAEGTAPRVGRHFQGEGPQGLPSGSPPTRRTEGENPAEQASSSAPASSCPQGALGWGDTPLVLSLPCAPACRVLSLVLGTGRTQAKALP